MRGISWLGEGLLPSQQMLCSTELVSWLFNSQTRFFSLYINAIDWLNSEGK
jgi:hypothetical protein